MTSNHVTRTSDYLLSTDSVLNAGKRLRQNLNADQARREFAVTQLERAAQQHGTGGASYQTFMFSELSAAPESDKATRERVTEDVLATVMTDLQIANTLMAAGQTLGETGGRAEPHLLDEALLRLGNSTQIIERSLPSPLAEGATPGRFGFTEEAPGPETVKSADLPSAVESFRKRSDETLSALVEDAKGVVMSVIDALSKIDSDKVLAALSKLSVNTGELQKVGRLFRQGVEKLQGAIEALLRLLGDDLVASVKEQVEKIWNGLKDGKFVAAPLAWAFGVEAARNEVTQILQSAGLKQESLDEASNALAKLRTSFKENMSLLEGIASAVGLAGTLLFLVPGLGPNMALVAAGIYGVILAAVVLIGMDYTDSGVLLKRVDGVREIAKGAAA